MASTLRSSPFAFAIREYGKLPVEKKPHESIEALVVYLQQPRLTRLTIGVVGPGKQNQRVDLARKRDSTVLPTCCHY